MPDEEAPTPGRQVRLLLGAACLPVVAYALHLAGDFRSPILGGDYALLEIWTRSALDVEALVGPYSRYRWNHPGPLVFYLWSPLYALSGQHAASLALGAVAVNLLAIVGVVATLRRVAGLRGAWTGTVVVTWFLVVTGPTWFDEPWNPVVVVLPLAAALCTAAAVVSGRPRFLVVTALAASFAVQSHLSTAPPLAPALVFVGLAVLRGLVAHRDRWLRPTLLAGVALLVVWAPPLYEQLTRNPGNLSQLQQDLRASEEGHGLAEVLDVSAPQFTLSAPDLMRVALGRGAPRADSGPARIALLAVLVLGSLALSLRLVVTTNRRRPPAPRWSWPIPYPGALGLIASASGVSALLGFSRAKGPLAGYLTLGSLAIGLTLYLALALLVPATWPREPAAPRAGPRRAHGTRLSTAAMAVAVVPALVLSAHILRNEPPLLYTARPDEASPAQLGALERLLADRSSAVTMGIVDLAAWPTATLVVNHLEREGWTVTSSDDFLFMFGDQRSRTGCETRQLAFRAPEHTTRPPAADVTRVRVGRAYVDVTTTTPSATCEP